MSSTPSTSSTPAAPLFTPPEDRAAAFLRSERERIETAVLKFVSQNPGTDAEIVSQRVGMPKPRRRGCWTTWC